MRRFAALRALTPVLLVLAGIFATTGRAAAQECTEEPCGPMDTTPPTISISPPSGTLAVGPQSVSIAWSDNTVLNHNSRIIMYGDSNVTSAFSYTWTTGSAAQSTGTVNVGTGSRTLTAYICDMSSYGPNCRDVAVTYTGPTPPVRVSAETAALTLSPGHMSAARFRLVNLGTSEGQYAISTSCPPGFASCSASATSVTLAGGDSAWVDAYFMTPASGGGTVSVTAAGGSVSSTGSTSITTTAAADPGYPGDAKSLLRIQRDACVVVALGPGTASECGDLRVVHPLPSARVLNRTRTPVLTYNSDQARPHPVVAAQFAGPPGTVPDSIRAVLVVNGTEVASRRWRGWGADQTRRIALAFEAGDPAAYRTGVYPYTLTVTAEWLGGAPASLPASRTGRMIIVNRAASPFGAGWWLSGVEQLVAVGGDSLLWVGGDGSARLYGKTPAGSWRAEAYDRPDSIYRPAGGTGYVRPLPGGARVHFGSDGYHTATENAVGHLTRFRWNARPVGSTSTLEMRLDTLILPSPSGQADTLRYLFAYGGTGPGCTTATTGLTRVSAPAPAGGYRDSWLCGDNLRRLTRIADPAPSTTAVTFAYHASTRWMVHRTDRRGAAHGFSYIRVRLHTSARTMAPGVIATTRVQAVQTLGMNGASVRADSVNVIYDGARPITDVCDCVWWKVDRWGAPTSSRNALGQVTAIRRGDARWPGAVTEMVAPNGFTTTASYDALGYVAATTAWNPYGDTRNATTTFRWNDTAAAPARIVAPQGEVSMMGYDAHGRRAWEQVGPDSARRVRYVYNANAHAGAPGLLERVVYPGGGTERVEYDARGNLSATLSPLNARSEFESDRLGRPTVQRVAIDTLAGAVRFQGDSTTYDDAGRPKRVVSFAPDLLGEGVQQVVVVNGYDPESNLTSVSRWSVPDPDSIGAVITRWVYDLGGRRTVEVAPDNTPADSLDNPADTTVYDLAGNVLETRTRRVTDSGQRVVVSMRYDALNRLVQRITPAIRYDSIEDGLALRGFIYPHEQDRIDAVYSGRGRALPYPWYPNDVNWGYRIPGDTARYVYDSMGNTVRADNRDAWIRRGYYPGGALRADTLKVRTVAELAAGGDSTSHVYALAHAYDLNGRRTELVHPASLAPQLGGTLRDRTRYVYDRATGELASVSDPLGNTFRYHYNVRGQLDSLSMPGGLTDEFGYDLDGRLARHVTRNASTSGADRFAYPVLRDEVFRYDARGKMLFSGNRAGAGDTTRVWYTGLGYMRLDSVVSRGAPAGKAVPLSITSQQVVYDALGNRLGMRARSTFELPWRKDYSTTPEYSDYELGTSRLLSTVDGYGTDVQLYDRGGNVVFNKTVQQGSPNAAAGLRDHAYFYGGDGMLRGAESRVVDDRRIDYSNYRRAFEEYRYDALGRRVWVRARRECHQAFSGYCELGWVRRTVWDGDRELYEIQAPSSGEVPYDDARREYDTTPVNMGLRDGLPGDANEIDPNPFYGRVAYTYGPGIDQPVSVVRMAYADMRDTLGNVGYVLREPFAIVPLWNSRGQPALGAFADGTWRKCTGARCVKLTWPELWAGYARPQMFRDFWHGTLLQDKQDGSGLHYRRNRYYDPATGRFTQEDPIGLAGGVNLYGFAEGDPVSYADPYGLAVCFRGATKGEVRGLIREVERVIGSRVTVGRDNCVTGVTGSGTNEHRSQFEALVSSSFTYWIQPGTSGSRFTGGILEVDPGQAGIAYWTYNGTQCIKNGTATLTQIVAHELAHAYQHNHRRSLPFPLRVYRTPSGREIDVYREYGAVYFENEYLGRVRRSQRCRYADEF
jgi:RHS repeat-associated protein